MKKLSIVFAVIIVLLAGCIQITPHTDVPATPEPSPAVSAEVSPADTPADTLTDTPADTPEPEVSASPVLGPPPALPVVSDRALVYDNEHIDVDIHCPEISGMLDSALQQDVNDSAYYGQKDKAYEIEQESVEDPAPTGLYYMNSSFTVRRNDGIFLSIREEIEYYNGGANIGGDLKFINLMNNVPGRRLALGDLFLPGVDYTTLINNRISGIIAADPEMADFWFTSISADQGFYITGSDLVIAFNNHDIAPGASGPQEFVIPLADISGDLIPELS